MKSYTITVNGNVYNVTVEEGITASASAPAVKTSVPAAPAVSSAPAAAKGSVKIEAPMSGKILGVKASAGQTVKRGDVIVVLEAMKMENEVVATKSGTVAQVAVTKGQVVETGTPLVVIA